VGINRVEGVPFAQIANSALRDRRLSFKARGILAMVLSNVGEWEATASWIMEQSEQDGITSIQSGLNELTKYGYRQVSHERDVDGRVRTVTEWFHLDKETRSSGNPTIGKPDHRETRAAIEDYSLEHHTKNTIVRKPVSMSKDSAFQQFWSAYPRKEGKGHAKRAWLKASRDTDPQQIVQGAERYRDDPNRDKQYTRLPATWLNGECWDDDPLPKRDKPVMMGPVTVADQYVDEPCKHGDPRGEARCALCRSELR
jgi:hypothetical protein